MHLETARERLGRRQQPLLQPDDEQASRGPRPAGRARMPLLTRRAVLVEQTGQLQLGRIFGKAGDLHPFDVPFRKPALDLAKVLLQTAHHHVVQDAPAGGRRSMVRLVENQETAGRHRSQPLAQRVGVGGVDQQVVGDQKAAVGAPGVDAEAALPAHSRYVAPVEYHEDEPETILELALPLFDHRRRHGGDNDLRLAAQEQLAGDQARLDGLAGRCRRR